jgi:hypothetical protein
VCSVLLVLSFVELGADMGGAAATDARDNDRLCGRVYGCRSCNFMCVQCSEQLPNSYAAIAAE